MPFKKCVCALAVETVGNGGCSIHFRSSCNDWFFGNHDMDSVCVIKMSWLSINPLMMVNVCGKRTGEVIKRACLMRQTEDQYNHKTGKQVAIKRKDVGYLHSA